MIAVRKSGSSLPALSLGSDDERSLLRRQFADHHHLRLPGFLDRELFDEIARGVDESRFVPRSHDGIGEEACMEVNAVLARLLLLVNDQDLFAAVRELTGCGPIGCFDGRVYRMGAPGEHYDSWHSDIGDSRLVAMSVNLSTAPYSGGLLQIREHDSDEISAEVPNLGPGDAILFRLSPDLRHQVTPVEGSAPRTAFAGWFKSSPTLLEVLKGGDWTARDRA